MTGPLLTRLHKLAGMLQGIEHRSTVLYPPVWTRTPAGEPPELIEGEGTIVYDSPNVIPMFPEVRTVCLHPAKYPGCACIRSRTISGGVCGAGERAGWINSAVALRTHQQFLGERNE